ncbi:hypothetical protein B0I35DRAFT_515639 [Stachybotrys elegans]|uniref:FAD-binding domain-containing protein n=1 Tax=Stachybotrys elegans TaxID=80388 RepID=A0A8K0WLB5_9HYPO|nr:hypothetical protein B0I35DRAFT_515639 [Stachybotrys elegans]
MAGKTTAPFRVIIVGAGPVGLFFAHALSKAGVDYLVMEQSSSIIRYKGAGIMLFPDTLRLLDQLGLYDKAEDFHTIESSTDILAQNGRVTSSYAIWSILATRHAYPSVSCSRGQLIELLYENLPEKETRVRTSAAVVDIEAHDNGVNVRLADGSQEQGSIIVGVDGVYSKTRQIMQRLAQSPPDTWPITASYRGLYGQFPSIERMERGHFYQSRGHQVVSQFLNFGNVTHFAILQPIPPTTERRRYTTEERDQFAHEFEDIIIAPGVRFKEVWPILDKETARLVNQEEGYCDKWYHGRIALAGDAVHKITSATGLGGNIGIHTAAALANELHRALQANSNPSTEALEKAFARYQETRSSLTSELHMGGRQQVRTVTWETWFGWFFDRIVLPWIGWRLFLKGLTGIITQGQILEYVPFKDREVQVPWANTPPLKE